MSAENGAAPETTPAPGTIERVTPRALSQRDPAALARAAGSSGYWKHIKNANQAYVIMAAGEELGLSPLASFQGITMIEGQIGYRGNLIALLITQHDHYGFEVIERKNDRCTLQFTIDGEPIDDGEKGIVTFTVEDAKAAELVKPRSNWVKWPKRMCFWRCLTEGAGIYFPDLTAGTPIYTDDEIREVIHVDAQAEDITDAEVADEAPRLDDETLDQLVKGYEIAGPALGGLSPLDGLNILLGSLGMDGIDSEPNLDIREVMAKWSPEQAEAVNAELLAVIDRAGDGGEAEEVNGEIVDPDEAAGAEFDQQWEEAKSDA